MKSYYIIYKCNITSEKWNEVNKEDCLLLDIESIEKSKYLTIL
jgi:hypothetical protein